MGAEAARGVSAARPYDIITFDCYGTLIDWEGGIAGAFTRAVVGTGGRIDPHTVLAAYERIGATAGLEARLIEDRIAPRPRDYME